MDYKIILENNRVIKNQKVLFNLFGWKYIKGKGRYIKLRELSRYCEWHTEGQKIIIDTIFDEPLEKIDGRSKGGHNIYGDLLDDIILEKLVDYEMLEFSFSELMIHYFELFTKEYSDLFKYDFCNKNNITPSLLKIYTTFLWSIVNQMFVTSLNRLQRQGVIYWEQNYFIKDGIEDYVSNAKLTEEIKNLDLEAMRIYNIHPFQKGIDKNREKIKKYVLSKISNPNIWSYYKVYYLELVKKDIELYETDIEQLKNLLRESITNKIIKKTFTVKIEDSNKEKYVTPYDNLLQRGKIKKLHDIVFGKTIDPSDPFNDLDEEDKIDEELLNIW